jgi:hypothetical protein
MKKFSNVLVVLFGCKCLYQFIIKDGTIADGLFLIAVTVYLFTLLDLKLPQDE